MIAGRPSTSNGLRPVNVSNNTQPSEYTSARASPWPEPNRSGAMYSNDPTVAPVAVSEADMLLTTRAMPKSAT